MPCEPDHQCQMQSYGHDPDTKSSASQKRLEKHAEIHQRHGICRQDRRLISFVHGTSHLSRTEEQLRRQHQKNEEGDTSADVFHRSVGCHRMLQALEQRIQCRKAEHHAGNGDGRALHDSFQHSHFCLPFLPVCLALLWFFGVFPERSSELSGCWSPCSALCVPFWGFRFSGCPPRSRRSSAAS